VTERAGPLSHLTVVEFAGLGPAPFAGMMLADQAPASSASIAQPDQARAAAWRR